MTLSPHFTLEELTISEFAVRHGLDNTPDEDTVLRLKNLATTILERIRAKFGRPLHINSGYRSPMVNAGIGGVPTSQHVRGEAADFIIPGISNREIVERVISDESIRYDQIILEGGAWVHVSTSAHPRRQALLAEFIEGKAHYSPFA